jgi:hypothetical protein
MKLLLVVFAALILVEDSADAIKCYACNIEKEKAPCSNPANTSCSGSCLKRIFSNGTINKVK